MEITVSKATDVKEWLMHVCMAGELFNSTCMSIWMTSQHYVHNLASRGTKNTRIWRMNKECLDIYVLNIVLHNEITICNM